MGEPVGSPVHRALYEFGALLKGIWHPPSGSSGLGLEPKTPKMHRDLFRSEVRPGSFSVGKSKSAVC